MTLTLKQQLAAAALSVAAIGGTFSSTEVAAQDQQIKACTGGNSNPNCGSAQNPKLVDPKPATGTQPIVVQSAPEANANVDIKIPKFTAGILLKGDAVGAPNPSSGIPMGYVSETESAYNMPLIGALGTAKGSTKPLPGVVDAHIANENCSSGINALNASGNAATSLPYVTDKREVVSAGVQGMIQKCGIVLKKALNCAAGFIQNLTKDACIPDPEFAAKNLAAQKAAAEKAAIEKDAAEKIAAADKAAADRIAAAERNAAEKIAAANKAARAQKPAVDNNGCNIYGKNVTNDMKAALMTKCKELFAGVAAPAAAAKAPAPAPASAKAPAPAAAKASAPAASR